MVWLQARLLHLILLIPIRPQNRHQIPIRQMNLMIIQMSKKI